jgi:hypothetical protein
MSKSFYLFFLGLAILGSTAYSTQFSEVNNPKLAVNAIKAKNKKVVTLIGFSGAEYENKEGMLKLVEALLKKFKPDQTIINIGATPDGIGAAYDLAKKMGFTTTGIVSTEAKAYKGSITAAVDHVYFVKDKTWGGMNAETKQLNPTSQAMIDSSDEVIAIGGGDVGRDEISAARNLGKNVLFVGADMNIKKAKEKAAKKNQPEPIDFRGTAELAEIAANRKFERIENSSVGNVNNNNTATIKPAAK